jgi:hypothetical protein
VTGAKGGRLSIESTVVWSRVDNPLVRNSGKRDLLQCNHSYAGTIRDTYDPAMKRGMTTDLQERVLFVPVTRR